MRATQYVIFVHFSDNGELYCCFSHTITTNYNKVSGCHKKDIDLSGINTIASQSPI